ncbi:hypothetical protein ACHWQZ_G016318 [Mnemiopsis leidyi]
MRKFNVVMIGPEEMWDIPEEIISRLNAPLAKEVDRVELPIDSDEEDEGYGSFGKQFMDLSLFAAVEKEEENDSKLAIREDELEGKGPLMPAESQFCIRVGNGVEPPVVLLDGSEPTLFSAHLRVVDNDGEEIDNIAVCEYSKKRVQKYRVQKRSGCVYSIGSVLNYTFRVSHDTGNLMCCLSLCHSDGTFLARSYLALDQMSSLDHISLPLMNETDTIIGLINCSIIEIRGLEQPILAASPPTSGFTTPLEIGHRGCGVTQTDRELFSELPCLPENTLSSMEMAYRHGAHMVETDVAVTQDLKAVLYHDLQIELAGNTKVPISHVTSHVLESVPSERLVVTEQQKRQQLLLGQDEDVGLEELEEKSKPYPYLSHALQSLPPDLGIMLEVKANLPEKGVENVLYHGDKNVFLDVILQDLFHHVGSRNIILCSFCADTCTMLRNKQGRWPVVLITQGSTETYSDYTDPRLACLQTSINLAIAENLQGVSMFSGLLQDDPAGVVSGVKESGLQTFVWGFHCCNQEFRDTMRSNQIDGIIYDRIYEEKTLSKRKS